MNRGNPETANATKAEQSFSKDTELDRYVVASNCESDAESDGGFGLDEQGNLVVENYMEPNHSTTRPLRVAVLTEDYLIKHEFVQIEGIQFQAHDEPIYHITFAVNGKNIRETLKCDKEDMAVLEYKIDSKVTMDYLKECLLATRNIKEESDRATEVRIQAEDEHKEER